MSKVTLPEVGSLANNASARQAINDNFATIEAAFEDTVSRSGALPNQMEADLDLNDNDLLNVKRVDAAEYFQNGIPWEQSVTYGDKLYDIFSGNGVQVDFPLKIDPASLANLEVTVAGLMKRPGLDYVYNGTTLTFIVPPAIGTNNILIRYDFAVPTGITTTDSITYLPPSTGIPDSLRAFLDSLWTAGTSTGAALIRFIQSGTGAVARTAQAKMRDVVHADDFGLVGDGVTDETTALQNLLDAAQGKVLMLGYGKTYGFATATGLTIPANTTLIANGSKLKRLTAFVGTPADSDYNIVVGDNVIIDNLEIDCVGGFSDISGVLISGSNVEIGLLKINTPTRSAANGGAWVGAKIGPNSGTSSNVRIGAISADLWDRAYTVQNVVGGSIGYVDIQRYKRGLYIKDCKDFTVNGGRIHIGSTGNTGKAGENGILIESTLADYSCERIRIENVTVENSGEHGFRIGGQLIARDIWHVDCLARGTGAGTGVAPPPDDDDHGGCGFKALGPTSVNGSRHQNIYYIGCTAESLVLDSLTDRPNFAGFQVGKCYNVSLDNCTVRPSISPNSYALPTVYSCLRGIEVLGCENATISNPNIVGAKTAGIMLYDAENAGGIEWGVQTNVKVTGGTVSAPSSLPMDACVEVRCNFNNMRRVTVDGLLCDGGASAIKCTVSGTGVITTPSSDITAWNQTGETLAGCGAWMTRTKGQFVGTNACLNGSMYQSWTAGAFRIMKAGAWTSL